MTVRDAFVDVLLEIPTADLGSQQDPTKYLFDRMRTKADETCDEQAARLRTDRTPEVVVRQGRHPLLGVDMTLVASRWAVVVPERVAAAL
jgi:hypothetical protein